MKNPNETQSIERAYLNRYQSLVRAAYSTEINDCFCFQLSDVWFSLLERKWDDTIIIIANATMGNVDIDVDLAIL
jgi:hypothetical protein